MSQLSITDSTGYQAILDAETNFTELYANVDALSAAGIVYAVTAKTANYTITAAQLAGHTIFTNLGAAGAVILTLPAGASNNKVAIYVVAAQKLQVATNGTETIRYEGTQGGAGSTIESSTVGDHWEMFWDGAEWVVMNVTGDPTLDDTTSINVATAAIRGPVELATDAETITGTDTGRAVTPAGLQAKVASATAKGIAELATDAETITGTDAARVVTPANLKAMLGTLTDGGILLGSGAAAITAMDVLADGEIIVGDGTTDPVAESGATARTSLGAAASGANSDITSLTGLTTPLTIAQGGTSNANYSGRNAIINGNFNIWQRGTSFTSTVNTYTADRWYMCGYTGDVTRQASGLDNSEYCLRLRGMTNVTGLANTIELKDTVPLRGKILTLSFYARKGAAFAGTFNGYIANNLSAEQLLITNPTTLGATGDIAGSLTTSWQKFTVTGSAVSTSAYVAGVYFNHNASDSDANNYVEIAQVQLEIGSVATDFEYRQIADELARCRRYYQIYGGTASLNVIGVGYCYATNTANVSLFFSQEMRAAPTITFGSVTGFAIGYGAGSTTSTGITTQNSTVRGALLQPVDTAAPFTIGQSVHLVSAGANGTVAASAEL